MFKWVFVEKGDKVPEGALFVGRDTNNKEQYVARGYFKGDLIPGKYFPEQKELYVSWNGSEYTINVSLSVIEVLTLTNGSRATWKESNSNGIPSAAFEAGNTSNGDTLFVGRRHMFSDGYHIGKVSLSQKICFIPFDGKEHEFVDEFDVLIIGGTPSEDKEIEDNLI